MANIHMHFKFTEAKGYSKLERINGYNYDIFEIVFHYSFNIEGQGLLFMHGQGIEIEKDLMRVIYL